MQPRALRPGDYTVSMTRSPLDQGWRERFGGIDRLYGAGALETFAASRVAVVGMGGCAALAWNDPSRLWPAYLAGFLTCWLVSMGGMGLVALGNLTGRRQ